MYSESSDLHQDEPPAGGSSKCSTAESRAEILARLFREHNQELIGFLCTRLRSEQDAREVAQEAYARLLGLDEPGAVSMLRAYLFRTAANLAIDRIRHRTTQTVVHRKLDVSLEEASDPSAEQLAARDQEAQLAAEYLRELPPRCREAFLLYRVYELTIDEVTDRMGVSDRMVRYYVIQAMEHVRARLDNAPVDGRKEAR